MPYKPKSRVGGARPSAGPRPAGPRPAFVRGQRPVRQKAEDELNINDEITAAQVRLVGDNIPEQGIYPISKAMSMADELGLDLVEISAKADPPVCRILEIPLSAEEEGQGDEAECFQNRHQGNQVRSEH